jgi:hypothetical protein
MAMQPYSGASYTCVKYLIHVFSLSVRSTVYTSATTPTPAPARRSLVMVNFDLGRDGALVSSSNALYFSGSGDVIS